MRARPSDRAVGRRGQETSAILIVALALPLALRADAPGVYAIRGARIVTASGAPIDAGTIVIRAGVIDAVGASVTVPADARSSTATG